MDITTARIIANKYKAVRHLDKVLAKIEKDGEAVEKLNSSGASLRISKNDTVYLRLVSERARLAAEIAEIEVISGFRESVPEPAPSTHKWTQERKVSHSEKMRAYWAERKATANA